MSAKTATQENATERPTGMKRAAMPGGNYVKIAVGTTVRGEMTEAYMTKVEKRNKKGKAIEVERYHFALALSEPCELLVGKKGKEKKQTFASGEIVTLPDHGFLTSTFRRTACEIGGVPYVPNDDTDLKPLVGKFFEITRREDGEIASGEFAGTASALYEVYYGDAK